MDSMFDKLDKEKADKINQEIQKLKICIKAFEPGLQLFEKDVADLEKQLREKKELVQNCWKIYREMEYDLEKLKEEQEKLKES